MLSTETGKSDVKVPHPRDGLVEQGEFADEAGLALFGATLAHELRGPLAPIVNGVHILKSTAGGDERVRQTLAMMERQLTHLTSLLDDLMDVGGFRSSNVRAQCEHVDLHQVVSASVEACAASIDARQQEIKIESEVKLLPVRGDPRRLTQVFTNLLANSNKYTPVGGHITIRLARFGDDAVVEVHDDGMGIGAEDLPHIFELFSQGAEHRYSPKHGLGIGLSVVKNIVELHGGWVSARSAGLGRGSVFTVRLPVST